MPDFTHALSPQEQGLLYMLRERLMQDATGDVQIALRYFVTRRDPHEMAAALMGLAPQPAAEMPPRYLMKVGDTERLYGLQEAGMVYDSGTLRVEFGGKVVETDFTLRDMTPQEKRKIRDLADEFDARK